MSKREKIILVLTAVVAMVGIFMMLFDPTVKKTSVQPSSMSVVELQQLVNDMSEKIMEDNLSDKDAYVIELATAQWENDPFSDVALSDDAAKDLAGEDVKMVYSGFVQVGPKLLAVINGVEYQSGEELPQPGYVLYSITPEKVVIKVGNRKTISLLLEETM